MRVVTIIILIILILFLLFQIFYYWNKKAEALNNLKKAETELANAKQSEQAAIDDLKFYSNQSNLEKELRSQFNYILPGEKMIIIVPSK